MSRQMKWNKIYELIGCTDLINQLAYYEKVKQGKRAYGVWNLKRYAIFP